MNANYTIKVPACLDRFFTWPVVWYRKRRYGDPFRKIPLGDGLFTFVDPQDYYRFSIFHWSAIGEGDKNYAVRYVNCTFQEINR